MTLSAVTSVRKRREAPESAIFMPAAHPYHWLGTKGRCQIGGFTKHEEAFESNSSSRTDTIVKTEAQLFSHARVNLEKPLCCVVTSPNNQYFSFYSGYLRLSVVRATTIETLSYLTLWRRNFLLNFSTPVFKMWIIQEPNKVALWNKRHFEEKRRRLCNIFKIFSMYIFLNKYIKCSVWRLALRYDPYGGR